MVGSVSAASENDDLQVTNDTDTVSTGKDAVISVSDSGEVLQATGTLTDLRNEISNKYGQTLTLTRNYAYANGDAVININSSITIDGQGKYTIDGCNQTRIFFINGSYVTLKNINFIKIRRK